jgi:hypothetical protein
MMQLRYVRFLLSMNATEQEAQRMLGQCEAFGLPHLVFQLPLIGNTMMGQFVTLSPF